MRPIAEFREKQSQRDVLTLSRLLNELPLCITVHFKRGYTIPRGSFEVIPDLDSLLSFRTEMSRFSSSKSSRHDGIYNCRFDKKTNACWHVLVCLDSVVVVGV